MNIDKLETDGKISKVKLLHDCAGTLRTAAALKNSLDKSAASVTKKHQALQNAQQQDLQGTNVTATLFNYQKALAAAERQAGVLYKEVQKNNNNDNGALLDSLRKTVQGYQQLHREAELLQEAFGLNNSAANIDFNDVDYFIAKLRCGAEEAGQQELFTLLFGDLPAKLQAVSEIDLGGNKITPQIANKDTDAMYLLAADFLNIMSAYEKAVQETFAVADLWRQYYQDEETVKALVRASLKLAHVGEMELKAAATALASVLRQYAAKLLSAYDAEQTANEIIDIWGKMSAGHGITVRQLAEANEQAGGIAYRSGIDFSYLQALLVAFMECSQKQGEEAGRYLRVLLLWMGTADAAMQLNKLGVDCYCLDAQGQKQLRRLQEVILEAAQKQAADKEGEKLLPDVAAGCFDAANLGALFGGYAALQQKLQTAFSAQDFSAVQYKKSAAKIEQKLLALKQQGDKMQEKLQQSNTTAAQNLMLVLTELLKGLKNLQPEFIAAFQGGTELLLLFKTILTLAEAELAADRQGISAVARMQAGKVRGSLWQYHC